MSSILFLGLLIGMQHALEADHIAAVSSIATRETTVRGIVAHGAVWGLGHTIALMLCAGVVLVLGVEFSARLSVWLEFAVGGMLVLLGGNVLYRLHRDRVHFHIHHHDNMRHFHAHSHAGEVADHKRSSHDHKHPQKLPLRSLYIGIMHGMAGSAALLVLTATTIPSMGNGLLFVAIFGLGSILGMAGLSVLIALPLTYSGKYLSWANNSLKLAVGGGTFILGGYIMYDQMNGGIL